ncbi:MAG TPA: 4Fe-4S binding protein [Pseudomonadales bacterium]|nr:4Fe-4S binding protein [Pseudomonadales bacterium]
MTLKIVDSCVNCWACLDVCPSNSIYPSATHFKINAKTCTECKEDYEHPQCASICPIEEAILDAQGLPLNPLGSLTGIPPERLEDAKREIQAR